MQSTGHSYARAILHIDAGLRDDIGHDSSLTGSGEYSGFIIALMKHEEHTHSTDRPAIREDAAFSSKSAPTPKASIPEGAYNANQTPPPLPWLKWSPGERVVVRYRLSDGLHDALGTLLETSFDHVVVETRRGPVRVEAATMVTGKKVPPPPSFIS